MSCGGNPYTFHEAAWQDFQSGSTTCRASTDYMNINTKSTQCGGAKPKRSTKDKKTKDKKTKGTKSTKSTKTLKGKSKKGGDYQLNMDNLSSYNDHQFDPSMSKYGSVMSGGAESEGATFSHSRFFDTNAILDDYIADSGFGVETAYGKSEPLDAGVGMLAPFNANKASSPLTMTQTGGAKPKKKTVKKPTIMNHIKGVISKIKNPFAVKSKTVKSKTV